MSKNFQKLKHLKKLLAGESKPNIAFNLNELWLFF